MGLFDDFNELFAGIKEFSNEINGLKDDLITSVVESSQEIKSTADDVVNSVSGNGSVTDASAPVDDTSQGN